MSGILPTAFSQLMVLLPHILKSHVTFHKSPISLQLYWGLMKPVTVVGLKGVQRKCPDLQGLFWITSPARTHLESESSLFSLSLVWCLQMFRWKDGRTDDPGSTLHVHCTLLTDIFSNRFLSPCLGGRGSQSVPHSAGRRVANRTAAGSQMKSKWREVRLVDARRLSWWPSHPC